MEALVFDMDGVLLDTERVALASVQTAAHFVGQEVPDAVAVRLIGLGRDRGSQVLRESLGADFPAEVFWRAWAEDYHDRIASDLLVKPGVFRLMDVAAKRRLRCAVATSTGSEMARLKLRRAGILERLVAVIGRDDVREGKPSPEPYLQAVAALGAMPSATWAFEDSLPGLISATLAGLRVHWVPDIARIPSEALPPGVEVIDSLEVVCDLLDHV
ncbi:MAG: HAD family hydrolase [Casimicrobiaceae bacterium]